jgi:hypothetical protein
MEPMLTIRLPVILENNGRPIKPIQYSEGCVIDSFNLFVGAISKWDLTWTSHKWIPTRTPENPPNIDHLTYKVC